jgi:radical SAM superfamily enzyme YgiQ (UPF0313 family)
MVQNRIALLAFYDVDSIPVCSLHSALMNAGFEPHTLYFKQTNATSTMTPAEPLEIDRLVDAICRLDPLFVGMSVRSTHFELAAKVTRLLKARKSIPVVWGGVHVILRPEQCLEYADIVCIGEGDITIVDLARRLQHNESCADLPNLWLRDGGGVRRNPPLPLIRNLDSLPFPDFTNTNKSLFEKDAVFPLPSSDAVLSYNIMTSRGCPYNCTYCCNSALRRRLSPEGSFVRRRSIDNVLSELRLAREKFPNLNFVFFNDDVFTFDREWVIRFCSEYRRSIALPFLCYCHPKSAQEDVIKALKDAGVKLMAMGIQTGSERFRKEYYGRYDTNEDIAHAAELLSKYGIEHVFDIILDNPLETEADHLETLKLLLRLPKPFDLHMHTLTHFPETELTNRLLAEGRIKQCDVEDLRKEGYERWAPMLDLRRPKNSLYWDCMCYLAAKKQVPRSLVRWASKNQFLKRYPVIMAHVLRWSSSNVFTMRRGSRADKIRIGVVRSIRSILAKPLSWIRKA